MQEKTWYEILEVPKNASKELIKAQYKKLSLKYHPDKNPQGEEKFKEISNAYEKAMDPSLKNAPAGFSFSSSTYSYGAKFKEHERGDVEEFLRSIIGAINPLKKDIPIEFRQSIVYMGGEWMGAQVLTDTEAHIFIVAFEYLVDQIIQPVTSSALGNVGQKNYIQQLKSRLMNAVVMFDHPIYRTFVPRSFYVENELLRFYLPIILESADTLKKIIKEMQLVMSWSNGLSEELAVSKELKEYLCIASPKYKERKEGLILSISIYDKGIDSLYKYLTKKIPNIRKYPVKQIKDRISINIPCEELNKIHIEWPICEKRKLVYRLQIAIDANDEKKVENLLIETAKQIDGDALKSIFNQLTQKTDIKLEIVKTLTQSLQGLMKQDFKDEIFINAVGESPVIIIKFFYSEFKPTSIFQRDIGTVAHNFARRFCGFCRSVEFDYFSDVKHFYFGDETVSKRNEEKRYGKGLNELIEIREIIKPTLEDCKQIKDKLGRTPAAYYKQYKRKTVFKQFLTLDAEKISNQEELAQAVEKKQIAAFLKFKEWVGESRLKRIESEQADKELKANTNRECQNKCVSL